MTSRHHHRHARTRRLAIARRAVLSLIALAAAAAAAAASDTADPAHRIERFAAATLERIGVPHGLGLAVVRDGEVLYAGGVGYRDAEAKLPVTADTVFYIASSTKSFTALATALLADRGALDLDRPVADYLPEAKLPGDEPVTLRHLLTHTAGLSNNAVVVRTAYTGDHDPATLVRLLASSEVGSREFDYTNLGYVVASLVLDRVTDGGWRELLRREIFEPLGMEHTTGYVSRAEGWPVATPFRGAAEGDVPMAMLKTDATMHAAGGTLSTPRDLAAWIEAQLAGGRLDGRQIFPERVILETQRQQASTDQQFFLFHRTGYGLGWYRSDYAGETLLHHFGGFEGWRAHVSFMPEHGIGVAAVINSSGHGFFLPDLVAAYAYDLLLGKPDLEAVYEERLTDYAQRVADRKVRMRESRAARAQRPWTLTLPRAAYAGTYRGDLFGEASISEHDGELVIRAGQLSAPLEPFTEPDSARAEMIPGSGIALVFDVADDGTVRGLSFEGLYLERAPSTATGGTP